MTNQEAIDTIKTALAQVEWDCPMDYAAAFDMAIKALEKQDIPDTNAGKWISVKDRLPEEHQWVLCQCRAAIRDVLRWHNGQWYHDPQHRYFQSFVTHWMPLPEAPKEE